MDYITADGNMLLINFYKIIVKHPIVTSQNSFLMSGLKNC